MYNNDPISHHGILGQKWGIRRYQNRDGTLTDEGKRRLEKYKGKWTNEVSKQKLKTEEKYERAKTRAGDNVTRLTRIDAKYLKKLEKFKEQIERIEKMSYSDMERELSFQRQAGMSFLHSQQMQQMQQMQLQNFLQQNQLNINAFTNQQIFDMNTAQMHMNMHLHYM